MTRPAARVADRRVGPMIAGIVGHVGGPTRTPGGPARSVHSRPAARLGDLTVGIGPPGRVIPFTGAMSPERTA